MNRILIRLKRLIKRFLKVKAATRQAPTTRARSKVYKHLMLILAACLIAFMYPAEDLMRPLDFPRKGEFARKNIIADLELRIIKSDDELRDEREAAADAVPTIIDYDTELVDSTLEKFDRFMDKADAAVQFIHGVAEISEDTSGQREQLIDSLVESISLKFPAIPPQAVNALIASGSVNHAQSVIRSILKDEIYFSGVLPDRSFLPDVKNESTVIRIGKREAFMVRDKLLDLPRAYVSFLASLNNRFLIDSFNVDAYYEIGRHFIIPNLAVNIGEIESRREYAMSEVPEISEVVSIGDVVVRANSKVTARQEKILEEMYRQREALTEQGSWFQPLVPVLARLVLILASFLVLYIYLYHFRNEIYRSNPKLLALFFIYGLELLFIFFIGVKWSLSLYLYPIAIFSILITVLFDAEVGTFNSFILALLLGILHRFNFPIALVTILVGVAASFSAQRVRHRSEFFKAILYLLVTYTFLILLLESFKLSPSEKMLNLLGFGWVNAALSPLLAMGILPVFESLFGFTTDITLLELSDLNNPLLKRLSIEAPGTYHHSLLVGNLSEAAAKTIDANPLLTRVGAYYHDIGKIEIPEYFVENQLGIKSKHDSLTPTMSSIILASHLKKGRALGEEADLPDEVLNFIEEHHGTMTMSYFLNKAKEMGIENPPIEEFQYPGPKPQTRETAIAMLADSVEAASRTLDDPKPARIRNLVQNIINDRFQSGELEECPLTLKDLAQIRESFVQILIGVFHHRIEYPEKEEEK
ncbi:MAG: HDIG domain-containing protein [Candidatus Zixiibacteriota bacterium]|nr:MAG: HDIG domain-containing protein [candidate division Zixibacteria bacterium]